MKRITLLLLLAGISLATGQTGTKTSDLSARPLQAGDKVIVATALGTNAAGNVGDDVVALQAEDARTDNPHGVTKTQLGLSNVDNTSDADKPISDAAQAALDLLDNVDNTSDADKPISDATQVALDSVAETVEGLGFVSVHKYGAIGDGSTDDTAAIQETINNANGRTVIFKALNYKVTGTVTAPDGVRIEGNGAVIDGSAIEAVDGDILLEVTGGTLTSLGALSADASKGDLEFTLLAASPPLKQGDTVFLKDADDFSFSPHRSYYRLGECFTVRAVVGSKVELYGSILTGDYLAAGNVEAFKLTSAPVHIAGLALKVSSLDSIGAKVETYGLKIQNTAGVSVDGVTITGAGRTALAVEQCYRVKLANLTILEDGSSDFGTDYGVLLQGAQDVSLTSSNLYAARHAFTVGGGSGIVNSRIFLSGCTMRNNAESLAKAVDTHGNSLFITISGCNIDGGLSIGGDHSLVSGCHINGNAFLQEVCQYQELVGANHRVTGCYIVAKTALDGRGAAWYCILEPETSLGGTLSIEGCTIRIETAEVTELSLAAAVANVGFEAGVERVNVMLKDNDVYAEAPIAGFSTYNATGNAFGRVSVKSNTFINSSIGKFWQAPGASTYTDGILVTGNSTTKGIGYGVFCQRAASVVVRNNEFVETEQTPIYVEGPSTSDRGYMADVESNTYRDQIRSDLGTGATNNDRSSQCWIRYFENARYSNNFGGSRYAKLFMVATTGISVGDTVDGLTSGASGIVGEVGAAHITVLVTTSTTAFLTGETVTNGAVSLPFTTQAETVRSLFACRDTDNLWHSGNKDFRANLGESLTDVTNVNP